MKVELLLKGIRMTREALEADLTRIQNEYMELQLQCPHTNAERKYRSSYGNYDPSMDRAWAEYSCPDCGKFWTETYDES